MLSGIAKALAATDPDRAERIAHTITDKAEKAWALNGIATGGGQPPTRTAPNASPTPSPTSPRRHGR